MKSSFVSKQTSLSMYKDLPVLVTGGCGFIGSHVAQMLVDLGAYVTILDNCSTGSVANIESFKEKVIFINKSITDPHACLEATHGKKAVFHLAALVSVPLSVENPSLCHQINVEGTFNMLEASRLNGVERFIFSSSAAVYGHAAGMCAESMPCDPQSPYGFSKWMGELYCKQYALVHGLKTVSMRYFNVYGERQNPKGPYAAVVASFKERMMANEPIIIYGDGMQTRDFVPVAQVVEANLALGALPEPQMRGDVFNIASGASMNLLELIAILRAQFPDYTHNIIFEPERAGDLKHSMADCSKYVQTLAQ